MFEQAFKNIDDILLKGRCLIVHRDPRHGEYTSVIAYAEHESAAPLAAPASPCCVRDLLPPE